MKINSLPRRAFLRTLAAGTLGAREIASAAERAASPVTVIDTHTHFYDPARAQGVPWPPKIDALLHRTVLPKEYLALPQPRRVTGTVVVEASPWVEDNQWILDLAASEKFIVGLVGSLPAGTAEFAGHLKRFAANPLFRGLRVRGDKLVELQDKPEFLADMRRLAVVDRSLDVNGGTVILPAVAKLAGAVPELRIIINHVANTKVDGKPVDAEWRRGMAAAARGKNVFCKVSGLVEGSGRRDGDAPRTVEFYRPVLDAIWEIFGADRLVYGSNWPVSARFAPCGVVQQIVGDYFQAKGVPALEKVFWRNAKTAYQWVLRG
ncbi:MAG: amidohydrolase family protein [Verrucomicrobia bacterium]|nr:amidohydrolase family protein [Verrucomicrobiota bacterium]